MNKPRHEFYPTPRPYIELLAHYEDLTGTRFLEPAAGDGRIAEFVTAEEIVFVDITRRELVVEPTKFHETCFIALTPKLRAQSPPFDLIVTNPPFSMALAFVKLSLSLLAPGGKACFLMRANFFHSHARYRFNRTHPPKREYRLAKRPKFRYGRSDSWDYSWFVYEHGHRGWTGTRAICVEDLEPTQGRLP